MLIDTTETYSMIYIHCKNPKIRTVSALKTFFNPISSMTTRIGWGRTHPAATSSSCGGPQLFHALSIPMSPADVQLLLVVYRSEGPCPAPNPGSCRGGTVVSLYNLRLLIFLCAVSY